MNKSHTTSARCLWLGGLLALVAFSSICSGTDSASTDTSPSTWDRFASFFGKKTAQTNDIKYHPKVLALLSVLSELETECKNVIAAFPDGKPLDATPILQAQMQAMFKTQDDIHKAIMSLQGDSTLVIDSRVTSAIETYEHRMWRVGTSEQYLLKDVQTLKSAITLAGASAVRSAK